MALVGIVLILAGGLYTLYRENIKSVDLVTSTPCQQPPQLRSLRIAWMKRSPCAQANAKSESLIKSHPLIDRVISLVFASWLIYFLPFQTPVLFNFSATSAGI